MHHPSPETVYHPRPPVISVFPSLFIFYAISRDAKPKVNVTRVSTSHTVKGYSKDA
jgi:hypothetical protein